MFTFTMHRMPHDTKADCEHHLLVGNLDLPGENARQRGATEYLQRIQQVGMLGAAHVSGTQVKVVLDAVHESLHLARK